MPAIRQERSCKFCQKSGLYWAKVQGPRGISVRLVDPVTGGVHKCEAYSRQNLPESPNPQQVPQFNPLPNPQQDARQSQQEKEEKERREERRRKEEELNQKYKEQEERQQRRDKQEREELEEERYQWNRQEQEQKEEERKKEQEKKEQKRKEEEKQKEEKRKQEEEEAKKPWNGQHKLFPKLLRRAKLRLNTLLVGPAGSGKTHAAHQVATSLGLKFYPQSVGQQTSKSDLIGYMDAQGKLVRTALRNAYELGGVYLLDEMDAGNAGVLTILNAITANDVAGFPDDTVSRHADFICIAAGNTYGQGANRQYVGRQQLDAATTNRFIGIDWDYDERMEEFLGKSQPDWTLFVWSLRKSAEKTGIKRIFGTRQIQQGTAMLDDGISLEEVKAETVFFGVPVDEKQKLLANI